MTLVSEHSLSLSLFQNSVRGKLKRDFVSDRWVSE